MSETRMREALKKIEDMTFRGRRLDDPEKRKKVWETAHAALAEPSAPKAEEAGSERLERVIELDRTLVARGLHEIEATLSGFRWLTTSRGSYEWDDDRWHTEFQNACAQIRASLDPLRKVAANLDDSPQDIAGSNAAVDAFLAPPDPASHKAEGCSRANSDMTPCWIKDGSVTEVEIHGVTCCVGCERQVANLVDTSLDSEQEKNDG